MTMLTTPSLHPHQHPQLGLSRAPCHSSEVADLRRAISSRFTLGIYVKPSKMSSTTEAVRKVLGIPGYSSTSCIMHNKCWPSHNESIVGLFVMHGIGILSTSLRLGYRWRRRQLYWDDFWAFVALIGDVVIMVVFLVICLVNLSAYTVPSFLGCSHRFTGNASLTTNSFIWWSTLFFGPTVMWATRLSIAVTVVRILPDGRTRLISKASCGVFGIMWLIVMVQKIFTCGTPVPAIPSCRSTTTPILIIISAYDLSF